MQNHFRLLVVWLVAALSLAMIAIVFVVAQPISVRAQAYSDPHGFFTDGTDYCTLCHEMHSALGKSLVRSQVESSVCFTCHDGTAANSNIKTELNLDPNTNAMHQIAVDLSNNAGSYQYTEPRTTAGIAPSGPYACSQCHNPHGATGFVENLRAFYDVNEYVAYPATPDPYSLCWSCHDTNKIVNDETIFSGHKYHIQSKSSPCTACHYSPHGVPYGKLVNFNPSFVTPSGLNSGLVYTGLGPDHGSCTLVCHGKDHQNTVY